MIIFTNLVQALTEGGTLATVFLAVQLLSLPWPLDFSSNPIVAAIPGLDQFLLSIPRNGLFLMLIFSSVFLQAILSISQYLNSLSVAYFAARCYSRVKAAIHSDIMGFTFACSSHYRVGYLTKQAGSGPTAVKNQITAMSGILVTGLMIIVYLAVLVSLSPWLLGAVAVLASIITLIQKKILPRIRAISMQLEDVNVEVSCQLTENIQALRLLHTSGEIDKADRNFRAMMGPIEASQRKQAMLMNIINPISTFLPIAAIGLIAGLSILLFGGRSTGVLPSLITFVLALQRLNARFANLASSFTSLSENAARIRKINDLLAPEDKQFRRRGGEIFHGLQKEIRFDAVWLQYSPDLEPALRGIDLVLPRGHTVALVGASGAGKSSIADLLVGLFDPTRGRILVDGEDLRNLLSTSWQKQIGVVSQDTFLFNASIASNISHGCPWATQDDIEDAAAKAQAHDFISQMPEGYNTTVGERGYRLSGGQRQRLSLARAILRNPKLLILDEATSALDSHSERLVQEAIAQFEQERTVLVIAHRLSTIIDADQIHVMRDGRIIQSGRHADLLNTDGPYAALWNQQVRLAVPTRLS